MPTTHGLLHDQSHAYKALQDSGALDAINNQIFDAMALLPAEYEGMNPNVLAVYLATALITGVQVVRDYRAGLAEVEGQPIGVIGAAAGQISASNTRRKLAHMRDMTEAIRASRLTSTAVEVKAYGFPYVIG